MFSQYTLDMPDQPKPGRRARPAEENEDAPPPSQRKVVEGGWGFGDSESKPSHGEEAKGDGAKPGRRRGVDSFAAQDADAAADSKRRARHFADDDAGDVMIIPDLEEDEAEDLTTQVAAAPRNTTRKVQSMRELDHEIKYSLPTPQVCLQFHYTAW